MQKKNVFTKSFEVQGVSSWRLLKHWLRGRVVLMGGAAQMPVLRQLLVLWVLHKFGKPLYAMRSRARHNPLLRRIMHVVRKIKP